MSEVTSTTGTTRLIAYKSFNGQEVLGNGNVYLDGHSASSIAALAATTGLTNGGTYQTKGYYTAGDGGGQDFIYRSTGRSGVTVDNGLYFAGSGADDYFEAVEKYVIVAERFGVKSDGTDCTARLQAAVNAVKSSFETFVSPSRVLKLDSKTYTINGPIEIMSGVTIEGPGDGCKITKGGSWSGDNVAFNITGGPTNYASNINISGLSIWGDFTAFKDKIGGGGALPAIINSVFKNLTFQCTNGFINRWYSQGCIWDNIRSYGAVNRFFQLCGNFNYMNLINAESASGSEAVPTFSITAQTNGPSVGWSINNILIENAGHADKYPIYLEDVDQCFINSCWVEVLALKDNTCIYVKDCGQVSFGHGLQTQSYMMKLETTDYVVIESLNTSGVTQSLDTAIDVDSETELTIKQLISRDGDSVYLLNRPNVKVNTSYNSNIAVGAIPSITGLLSSTEILPTGGNLLPNPSFDAGFLNWATSYFGSAIGILSFGQSEITSGKQLDAILTTVASSPTPVTGTVTVYQVVAIATEQVGQPFTFSAMVNAKTGAAGGYISLRLNGCGVAAQEGQNKVTVGSGWGLQALTFIPTSAGNLEIGFICQNVQTFAIDAANLSQGTTAQPDTGNFQMIQLGGRTLAVANASPSSGNGTWKVGDIVFNSEPSAGEPLGWICSVAGNPGTWMILGPVSSDGILPVSKGGTASTTAADARAALGLSDVNDVSFASVQLDGGQTFLGYGSGGAHYLAGVTVFRQMTTGTQRIIVDAETGFMDFNEISTPSAPSANAARTFSRDNGSGKTQYCVLFPSGAVQVLATEP